MTEKEIIQVLAILKASYPNVKFDADKSKQTVLVWLTVLGEYDAEAVTKAARLHASTSPFFPTPADIRNKLVRAQMVYRDDPTDLLRIEQGGKGYEIEQADGSKLKFKDNEELEKWLDGLFNQIEE